MISRSASNFGRRSSSTIRRMTRASSPGEARTSHTMTRAGPSKKQTSDERPRLIRPLPRN
jgi:hypothetical protein